ncbi:MAG: tRNA-intron lyase [archaeon]
MPLLMEERIIVSEPELKEELKEKSYGEEKEEELIISPEETLYLKEKRKEFTVKDSTGKKLEKENLRKQFTQRNKEFPRKYTVYKDLKDRGFCVKTGFKFGSHFRVYKRGEKPGEGHAKWLVHAIPEEHQCSFPELSRAVRLAQNVRKTMIYALVDKEQDITYYKIRRITP